MTGGMKKIILLLGISSLSVILTGCINFESQEINQDEMFEDYDHMVDVFAQYDAACYCHS